MTDGAEAPALMELRARLSEINAGKLLASATGAPMSVEPFLAYLTTKYQDLYAA